MKSLRLFFFVGLIGLTVECPGSQFTRAPVAVPTFAATARGQTVTLTWAQASETLDIAVVAYAPQLGTSGASPYGEYRATPGTSIRAR